MAKIPYFNLEQAPKSYTDLLKGRPPLNLYRMLPHATAIAPGFLVMGRAVLRESELDPQLRELVILRVGVLCKSAYEVHQHKRVARGVGLSDEKIQAIEAGPESVQFSDVERLVLRFTDDVVHNVKASDAAFNSLLPHFPHRQIAEIVLTIGFYMMVSRFLENFEVDIEPPGTVQ